MLERMIVKHWIALTVGFTLLRFRSMPGMIGSICMGRRFM